MWYAKSPVLRPLFAALLVGLFVLSAPASWAADQKPAAEKKAEKSGNPRVLLETDLGKMTVELFPKEAPETVKNFLAYVDKGFYDGTIFHRVVTDFVVQGGGFTFDFKPKETLQPVVNESDNGLKNLAGTLSMARTSDPDSATSQFFINLQDNPHLDPRNGQPGYAVFGKIVDGFEVAGKIEEQPRGMYRNSGFPEAPNYPVRILKATRL